MRIAVVFLTVALTAASAWAQQSVPPPPQPAPDKPVATIPPTASAPAPTPTSAGPTLEVTLKFIQDKVNEQGKIVYVESKSNSLTGEPVDDDSSLRLAHRSASAKQAGPAFGRTPMKKGAAGSGGGSSRSSSRRRRPSPTIQQERFPSRKRERRQKCRNRDG